MMKSTKSLWILLLAAIGLGSASCASIPKGATAVAPFYKEKYLGRWYEIARLPHRFERGLDYVTAEYSREEQHIAVVNRGVRNVLSLIQFISIA